MLTETMYQDNKIFFTEASLQKVVNYFFDVLAVLIIIYCAFYFTENPVAVSLAIAFLLFILFFTGHSQINVYSNRIEFIVKHPIDKLSSRRIFLYSDIESVEADLRLTKSGFILTEILSTYLPGNSIWNTLKIKMKNGTEKVVDTKVYKADVIKALQVMGRESGNKIPITGL